MTRIDSRFQTCAVVLALFAVLTASSACSSSEAPSAAQTSWAELTLAVVPNMVTYKSIDEQVSRAALVVDGTFEGLSPGETIVETEGGVEDMRRSAVAKIRVKKALVGDSRETHVYLQVQIGASQTYEEYEAAFPTAERVIVALAPAPLVADTPGAKVEDPGAGAPGGATIYTALPQGLFYSDGAESFVAPLGGSDSGADDGPRIRISSMEDAERLYTEAGTGN